LTANHCTVGFPLLSPGQSTATGIVNGVSLSNGGEKPNCIESANEVNSILTLNGLPTTNEFSSHDVPNGIKEAKHLQVHRNCHMSPEDGDRLCVFSAADESTLKRMMQDYKSYYQDNILGHGDRIDKLALTLAARRTSMLWRSFALADPLSDPQENGLAVSKPLRSSSQTGIAFVFTGQGAQYINMGLELLRFPVFKAILVRANGIFADLGCTWSLFGKLLFLNVPASIVLISSTYIEEIERPGNINRPEYSQPLCTTLQIALVELLKCFNINPVVVVGHSSGEIAAA